MDTPEANDDISRSPKTEADAVTDKATVDRPDEAGDDENSEETEDGMKSAYSVTDLLEELDSGSDDQVGICEEEGNNKQVDGADGSSCMETVEMFVDNTAVSVDNTAVSLDNAASAPESKRAVTSDHEDKSVLQDPCGGGAADMAVTSSIQDSEADKDIAEQDGIFQDVAVPAVVSDTNNDVDLPVNRKLGTVPRLDTLDRVVPMSESVKSTDTEPSPDHDYEAIGSRSQFGTLVESTLPPEGVNDAIYENVDIANPDDDEWDSSEFESFDETEVFNDEERSSQSSASSGVVQRNKDKPVLPPRNKKDRKSRRSLIYSEMPSAKAVLRRVVQLGSRSKQEEAEEEDEEDSQMMEVIISMAKTPQPQLSETPPHLTNIQITRRHIVSSIIESENSYVKSLRRIVQDYEKPLLEAKPQILSRRCIKTIFNKVKDILHCHTVFQIELAETIKNWDADEKIGNVFNASFSKSIVFDVYSDFVNNFSVAMDTAKKQARSKQAFAEFLKQQLEKSPDKLSLFGLMVKPVQRFPQFILLLQDLLKKTPQDHHDRLPLQMALTELENLTLRLNEEKRKSESRHDIKRIMDMLSGRFTLKSAADKYLIRQDDVVQSMTLNGETTSKTRRLFMLSDQLLCASIHRKQTESGIVEHYRYKWSVPIQEVEVVQTASRNKINGRKATLSRFEPPDPPPADHPNKKDLDDLLHDLPMMEQIEQLVSRLHFKYPMLTVESIHSNVRNLKLLIQQKTDIDQCILRLSLPTRQLRTSTDRIRDEVSKHIKQAGRIDAVRSRTVSARTVYSFQMQSPNQKQDWLLELQLAKLALDPSNNPGWYLPEHNSHFTYKLPLYGAAVTVDTSKQESRMLRRSKKQTKVWIHCATPVLLPSDQLDLGTQHLWVCSGEKSRGQISIVSIHTGQPQIIETFKSSGTVSVCAERVPGVSRDEEVFDDTVWMAAMDNKIHIYNVVEESRQGPKLTIDTKDMVVTLCYHDNSVYAGHQKGDLAVYKRGPDGEWQYKSPSLLHLGPEPVASLLLVGNHVWAGCGQHIHVIRQKTASKGDEIKFEKISHKLAQPEEGSVECMVKAGAGLIVSFRNKGFIRLYHFETLEHLQDINMASVARSFFEGKSVNTDLKEGLKRLCVTCLLAVRGLLWIGTNIGCLLTLPLPRLEGVPQIRGRPSVSYHGHSGSVKFLTAIHCSLTALRPEIHMDGSQDRDVVTDEDHQNTDTEGMVPNRTDGPSLINGVVGEDMTLSCALRNRWISTPDLSLARGEDGVESLQVLYESLMRGLDEDFQVDYETPRMKRMSKNVLSNLNAVSSRVTKFSGAMMNRLMQQDHGTKAATLPVLHEDSAGNHQSSSSDNMSSGSHHRDSLTASELACDEAMDSATSQDTGCDHYENVEIIRKHENLQLQNNVHHYQNVEMLSDGKYVPIDGASEQPEEISRSKLIQPAHIYNKALVVLSGGEGHINWNSPKVQDVKADDTCLIMWQVPP